MVGTTRGTNTVNSNLFGIDKKVASTASQRRYSYSRTQNNTRHEGVNMDTNLVLGMICRLRIPESKLRAHCLETPEFGDSFVLMEFEFVQPLSSYDRSK